MWTVKQNVETLYTSLKELGYRFARARKALPGPDPNVEQKIAFLEENIGRLPLALAAFYRIVGSVNFVGRHPGWEGCEYPDPLVVEPAANVISEAMEYLRLKTPKKEYWASRTGVFRIPIAPDYYHKEDVSGGMWYGVEIPNPKEDPDLLEERHHTTLLGYLRLCFDWGGFPGLDRAKKNHTWPLRELTRGLRAL